MEENFNNFTKAQLIEMLNKNLTKRDLNITDVGYSPDIDFPEREQHYKDKAEKQRIYNLTKGKGLKGMEAKK